MSVSLEEVEKYIIVGCERLYAEEEDGDVEIRTSAKGRDAQEELRAAKTQLASMKKRKAKICKKVVLGNDAEYRETQCRQQDEDYND